MVFYIWRYKIKYENVSTFLCSNSQQFDRVLPNDGTLLMWFLCYRKMLPKLCHQKCVDKFWAPNFPMPNLGCIWILHWLLKASRLAPYQGKTLGASVEVLPEFLKLGHGKLGFLSVQFWKHWISEAILTCLKTLKWLIFS